jgi:hypothetical protein
MVKGGSEGNRDRYGFGSIQGLVRDRFEGGSGLLRAIMARRPLAIEQCHEFQHADDRFAAHDFALTDGKISATSL